MTDDLQAIGAELPCASTLPCRAPACRDRTSPAVAAMARWRSTHALLTAGSGLLAVLGLAVGGLNPDGWSVLPYALAIGMGVYFPVRSGLRSLASRQVDMNVLMTIAATGAIAVGEWAEGALVVFLFSLGELLESFASSGRAMPSGPSWTCRPPSPS